MSFEDKGALTIGGLCPLAASVVVPIGAQLSAQLTGLVALSAGLTLSPPTIAATIVQLTAQLAALGELVAAGISFPPPTAQIGAVAAISASLNATVALLATLTALFAAGGIDVSTYDGPANGLGPALSAAFPGTGEEFAIILSAGADAGVKASLLAFFGGAA